MVGEDGKEKHPPKNQTKFANAVEAFKQMGKEEVEKKLNSTTTHLGQIELKVSKLLSEGTPPKDALATVKKQEEALRVKKAQLTEALGAFVTQVTRLTLSPEGASGENSSLTGKCETDGQNFKLTNDDDSAHQSGSPIAHMGGEGERRFSEGSDRLSIADEWDSVVQSIDSATAVMQAHIRGKLQCRLR